MKQYGGLKNIVQCVTAVFAVVALTSCLTGEDQLSGMYDLSFPSTAVCNSQQKTLQFRNTSKDTIVIEGAMISSGTDPNNNFRFNSMMVGSQQVQAGSGYVDNVSVPPGTNYTFNLTYSPQVANTQDKALFDIVYSSPREGVIQVALDGAATSQAPNCPTQGGPQGTTGTVTLDGNAQIIIERLALFASALPDQAITTDISATVSAYSPVTLPLSLDLKGNQVTLQTIVSSDKFILPRAKQDPLNSNIPGDTQVTTTAAAIGSYQSDGSLTIPKVTVHMKEPSSFDADFDVTLQTAPVSIPSALKKADFRAAGFNFNFQSQTISGAPIDPKTYEVTLVGVGTFGKAQGPGDIVSLLNGVQGAVLIQAKIIPPAGK